MGASQLTTASKSRGLTRKHAPCGPGPYIGEAGGVTPMGKGKDGPGGTPQAALARRLFHSDG